LRNRDLSMGEIIALGFQLCESLERTHLQGIIYGNLNPLNITVGGDGQIRLPEPTSDKQPATEKDAAGENLETLAYISPEQVKGSPPDARSDLFSFGVILYEMIAGRQPFQRPTRSETIAAITDDVPDSLSRYQADAFDELERIVSKLLEKRLALRYQSAADVAADLQGLLPQAKKPAQPPVDWWNRYVVVGAVIVLTIIGLLWLLQRFGVISGSPGTP
jgi:serine/threonine protein kinase